RGRLHHRATHPAAGALLVSSGGLGHVHRVARALPQAGRAHSRGGPERAAGPAPQVTTALQSLRVLDLTRLLPGPVCTMLLGDLGADVVKIEEPARGDPVRQSSGAGALYFQVNRNKRSITLDLKSEQGRDLFLQLVDSADVVVEGFRPGVMQRLGLGFA